jgi:hypothetical protein
MKIKRMFLDCQGTSAQTRHSTAPRDRLKRFASEVAAILVQAEPPLRMIVCDADVHQADLGQTTVLLDTDTGEELQEYIAAYGGQFHIGQSGENFGVDEEGFFIRRDLCDGAKEVFRAMRIWQKIPDSNF